MFNDLRLALTGFLLGISFLFSACNSPLAQQATKTWSANLKEFDDSNYPDNPDKSIRSHLDGSFSHSQVVISEDAEGYSMHFLPASPNSDTLVLTNLDLGVWTPFIPQQVRNDSFFQKVAIQNSEFNRQQVTLDQGQFSFLGQGIEKNSIHRVDLARNCLNGGLWELIAYSEENGSMKPAYHCWFDFPENLYARLFEARNRLAFQEYRHYLYNWVDLPSEKLNLDLLRKVEQSTTIPFESKNDEMYLMVGERKKKAVNIVYPISYTRIQDFLTDSATFSTFSPPGLYERKTPKHTQLGKLAKLENVDWRNTKSTCEGNPECFEIELKFQRIDTNQITKLTIGGLILKDLPQLNVEMAHNGFQMPMGVSNHSFYEKYSFARQHPQEENPFFALLMDENDHFLDSHNIGIDGPLLHLDAEDASKLHIWLLSFERHSLVGHYIVNLPQAE